MLSELPQGMEPYYSHYVNFIQKRQSRGILPSKKYERHHILPVSMGAQKGFKILSNIVLLTPREHYIAHLILYKAYRSRETALALWKMQGVERYGSKLTSRQYEVLRSNLGGWHQSEEVRKEISKALKGKKVLLETCKKISQAKKGHKVTEETKQKISETLQGKRFYAVSEETRKKMSVSAKNKVVSEETKIKMSIAAKNRVVSKETKIKLSKAHEGKNKSEKTKQKMSSYSKNRSPEHLEHLSEALRGREFSEEHKQKLKEAWKRRKENAENRTLGDGDAR